MNDHELDEFFQAARSDTEQRGEAALSPFGYERAVRSALQSQPADRMMNGIGGWGAGGMLVASAIGVWLGIAPPAELDGYVSGMLGSPVSITLPTESDWLASLEE